MALEQDFGEGAVAHVRVAAGGDVLGHVDVVAEVAGAAIGFETFRALAGCGGVKLLLFGPNTKAIPCVSAVGAGVLVGERG